MAAADVAVPAKEPAVPDYLASPNAVFDDKDVQWRYGRAPDYSKTRAVWEETKSMNHTAGSLPQLVENLVKNWEVEASFKPRLEDWRTIDHANYSFAINGGKPQTAEHMLKVGTYNAIITANEYYSPEHSDFASSHKTFKRMMPTFAWEVLEVYSGPPKVSFRWRHWGEMQNDYVGFNNKGEKITVKAHGGKIDIQGVTVAEVDDKVRLRAVETWFDPLEMFHQMAPDGIVNKQIVDGKVSEQEAVDEPSNDGVKIAKEHNGPDHHHSAPEEVMAKDYSQGSGQPADAYVPHQGTVEGSTVEDSTTKENTDSASAIVNVAASEGTTMTIDHSHAQSSDLKEVQPMPGSYDATTTKDNSLPIRDSQAQSGVTNNDVAAPNSLEVTNKDIAGTIDASNGQSTSPNGSGHSSDGSDKTWEKVEAPHDVPQSVLVGDHPRDMEEAVEPAPGQAVAAPARSEETRLTHEELSNITAAQCPFLMNRE